MNAAEPLLFPSLLGAAFDTLPTAVRALHVHRGAQRLEGEVEVERGCGRLSRLCARATRLPPPGRGPIEVEIVAAPGSERWTRRIAGHAMPSRLWGDAGLLYERLGVATFAFRLRVRDDAIVWKVERVRALGLPLPARWFAGVTARESEHGGRYRFDVVATLPWIGPLVRYRGWLDVG